MKGISLISLLLILFVSCKRLDGDTLVEGQVIDKHTGQGVANAKVQIWESNSSASWGGYKMLEEHPTNSEGKFGFQFEGSGDDYQLRAYSEQGYGTSWNDAVAIRQGRNNKKLKVKADAPAWVRIILTDIPPIGNVSSIKIQGAIGVNSPRIYSPKDSMIIASIIGGQNQSISWSLDYNSQNEDGHFENSQFYPVLDTTTLEISF